MATVLVVDDSTLDRYLAGALIQEHPGWEAIYAEDGQQALDILRDQPPDLVLTDLQMPEINGLELVEAIQRDFPLIPVILMTGVGSEEIAVAALKKGAASYVPKRNLAGDLARTVEKVLGVALASRNQQHVQECLDQTEFRYVLANDISRIGPIIGHVQDQMVQMKLIDRTGLIRVGTALHEVLVNAIEHGNLEMQSQIRENGDLIAYRQMLEQRRQQSPYRDRRVRLHARISRDEAVCVVADEGSGFDPARLPDPTDSANLEKAAGRGIFLVRMFMDEVRFNAAGNEVTLIKRRSGN
jgi:CheY-like chemotaxis protein/anti-sigma regulatory factor (Ser/Thr protein kinase)